jgi:hypothetical protein
MAFVNDTSGIAKIYIAKADGNPRRSSTTATSPTRNVALQRQHSVSFVSVPDMEGHAAQTARQAATRSIASAGMSPVSTPCVWVSESSTSPLGKGSTTTSPTATAAKTSAKSLRQRRVGLGLDIPSTVAARVLSCRKPGSERCLSDRLHQTGR